MSEHFADQQFDAVLVSYQGSRAIVRDTQGNEFQCKLRQSAREAVTGDSVGVQVTGGEPVVVDVQPRQSEFFRTDMRGQKKMIAANLSCLVIVIAPEPEPHLGLIDRYLVGAELSGLKAQILINKSDLPGHPVLDEVRRIYPRLGYQLLEVSAQQNKDMDVLAGWSEYKKLAFLGQSGVGKTSLINALTNSSGAVGALSSKRAKGRHTTTASYLYQMTGNDGWIMDSPGIRDFENVQWQPEEVIKGFPELHDASLNCKYRNCRHLNDQGCAIVRGLREGAIELSRVESYRNIMSGIQS